MRHLITSGLPYINGVKHLGNLVGSMLPADVYARWLRQRGEEVLYICGTDEHGAPAELAAAAAGEDVAAFCERMYGVQSEIYRRFGLSFDHFGRTSRPPNHALTQRVFQALDANGFTERRTLQQIWSEADGRFLPDRYVEGTCPHCGNTQARGDQCELCTRLLDPTDLIAPRSAISKSTDLEIRDCEHVFLKLTALSEPVSEWVTAVEAGWPDLSRQIARKWLGEGLQDRCITRDLDWGVPVPVDDLPGLVFYVWFDAPIGYIAATIEWAEARGTPDDWESWWRDDAATQRRDVHYTQFMGKDNLPFHTVMFPAMLLGADDGWKLVDTVKGFHWMQYYGDKFSTSQGRGVFTDAALALYPPDYWRYALMARVPESADSNFTWPDFQRLVNSDLAGVLGNFVNRVLSFTSRKLGAVVPAGGSPGPREAKLQADCAAAVAEWDRAVGALEFRAAMKALRHLWTLGNVYIDERAPWSLMKTDPDEAEMVIRACFNLIRLNAVAAAPVIPELSAHLLGALGLPADCGRPDENLALDGLAGRPFTVIPPAIQKIEAETVAELEARFGT